mgnify:CR=1 FL=1
MLAGVLLFLLALFAIASRSFLFSDTFFVRSRFDSVAGLLPGAEVHYQGVNVGRVESVRLPDAQTVWQAEGGPLAPGNPVTLTWDNGEGQLFRIVFTIDENYIRESILEPQAKIRAGYKPAMPTYRGRLKDDEISAIIAFIKSLKQ